ncbi:MAG: ABC transporter permease [Kiloniellales bacterium]
MTASVATLGPGRTAPSLPLALRLARRELRAGLSGFRIFLACLLLGVGAIAGVGSVSQAMLDGLRDNGRVLLGGDLDLRLVHRKATPEQLAWLSERATLSEVAEMRAMARAGGPEAKRVLIELRAADEAFPLYGETQLEPAGDLQSALAWRDGAWGAVADGNLLRRLGVALGDRVQVGEARYQVRAVLAREPDRAARGLTLGPTFLVARDSLAESGLEQPGSLIHYHYRLRLPAGGDVNALRRDIVERFPEAGWRIRDTGEAAPGLRRFIQRLTQFLALVGLTSLLVGGVGVGNAVKSYLEGKRATIATLKCLGAPARLIFQTYLLQVMALALLGVAGGLLLGAAAPYGVALLLGDQLGWQATGGFYPLPLAIAATFGLLTALAFTLWPLARARHLPAASLFRSLVAPVSGRLDRVALLAVVLAGLALAALAVLTARDRELALYFVAGATATLGLFWLTARGVMALARRAPRSRRPGLRLAVANLHRPGAPTGGVVMSLGLGLTVLVAIALIEGNLAREVRQSIPEQAPAFYFIDIQPQQLEEFKELARSIPGVSELKSVPMLRGRLAAVNGVPPDRLEIPSEIAWVFRGDRGLTCRASRRTMPRPSPASGGPPTTAARRWSRSTPRSARRSASGPATS